MKVSLTIKSLERLFVEAELPKVSIVPKFYL